MVSNESDPSDGAAVRFPPPLVTLIALAVGLLLQHFVRPITLPLAGPARYGLGLVVLVAGISLIAAALGRFRSTGQNPEPWASTPEIISTGVYRFTRNPMYVSLGLLQAGIGVMLANGWLVLLVPLMWAGIYIVAIRHEEAYLERKFGSRYTDYKKSVRRWL
jgi:protein-S-isoprenylcysteine O-methyltransferase Ste14